MRYLGEALRDFWREVWRGDLAFAKGSRPVAVVILMFQVVALIALVAIVAYVNCRDAHLFRDIPDRVRY